MFSQLPAVIKPDMHSDPPNAAGQPQSEAAKVSKASAEAGGQFIWFWQGPMGVVRIANDGS